jgi:hypothetical protein
MFIVQKPKKFYFYKSVLVYYNFLQKREKAVKSSICKIVCVQEI